MRSIAIFLSRISKEKLIIPSIVIVEFIKVAGARLGVEQAGVKLKLWIARGVGVFSVDEETASLATRALLNSRCAHITMWGASYRCHIDLGRHAGKSFIHF
jgi:hypothetical protein